MTAFALYEKGTNGINFTTFWVSATFVALIGSCFYVRNRKLKAKIMYTGSTGRT
jgi:hypothetical protein